MSKNLNHSEFCFRLLLFFDRLKGFDVLAPVYKAKKSDVEALSEPIFFRLAEASARPEAVRESPLRERAR